MDGQRPLKRPRLDHAARFHPDGFAPSKATTSGRRVHSVPAFVSAFDTNAGSSSGDARRKDRSKATSLTSLGTRLALPAMLPRPDLGETSRDKGKGKARESEMRVLRPPNFDLGTTHDTPKSKAKSLSSIMPGFVLPSPVQSSRTPSRALSTRSIPQFAIKDPAPTNSSLKPLQAMLPPPLPAKRPAAPGVKMTRITNTRIARMTDPKTEHGAQELLSLFLQQHGSGYIDPVERELKRGLEQSPEKRTKSKNQKFILGGLAEAASRRLAATRGNHSLWELEIDRLFRPSGSSYNKSTAAVPIVRKVRSDLRLRLKTVLFASSKPSNPRATHAPLLILARCTVLQSNLVINSETLRMRAGKELVVLFRLSENSHALSAIAERPIVEGGEVCVWRPWSSVELPPGQSELGGTEVLFCSKYFVPPPVPPPSQPVASQFSFEL